MGKDTEIADRVSQIQARIIAAARRVGREPSDVQIVAVSKKQPPEKMRAYLNCAQEFGVRCIFGENYAQELKRKRQLILEPCSFHFIGALQKNKITQAVLLSDMIESVHSAEAAAAISAAALKIGRKMPALLQINISGDPQKSGFSESEIRSEICRLDRELSGLEIGGVMTITQLYDQPESARPDFKKLRELALELQDMISRPDGQWQVSMGMSADFEIAVEEGATIVRIGTAIFGERA